MQRDAWTKSQQVMTQNAAIESHAKAKAEMAKARKADAETSLAEAEVKEKIRAAKAEADARIRVAEAEEANKIRVDEAETTTKIRVAAAEAREADLKILKLGKEIDVFTGECEVKEYLCFLSVRPSLCLSLTACFSDYNSLSFSHPVFATVFPFCFSRQACRRTAQMMSSVAGPCS